VSVSGPPPWSDLFDQLRHRINPQAPPPPSATADGVLGAYADDNLRPLLPGERTRLPAMSRCINCGLCALVVRRFGRTRLPDLADAYLRDPTLLPAAIRDLDGDPGSEALAAAAAVCPVGVPLDEVAAAVRRLAGAADGGQVP
jgi:hypothetical protein